MSSVSSLEATTVELAEPVDLLDVAGDDGVLWEHDGEGLAGRGRALRLRLPVGLDDAAARARVAEALASIARSGQGGPAGTGPVAIGALPFATDQAAELVVPEVVVRRLRDGRSWQTTIRPVGGELGGRLGEAHDAIAAPRSAHRSSVLPDAFTLVATVPHVDWCKQVAEAVEVIAAGALQKVVLAREVVVEANRPIVVSDVVGRLRALYPSCMVFSVDGFVGASPELLVARHGTTVRSHPLAGTFPRSGDPPVDDAHAHELLTSEKDRWEHQLVVNAVAEVLTPLCRHLDVPTAPTILPLRNVLHLGTEINGALREPAPTALELVARLHPTPAVGGTPRGEALAYLRAAEAFERGRYAGPVGWIDGDGDGEWAIAIRSAEIAGTTARLFAGVGIVDGSEPEAELQETQLKLQATLAALVRP